MDDPIQKLPVTEAAAQKGGLHPDILKLGLVSFLTDLSSEMVFSVFAIFFTTVAGASASLLGLIEGLADFSASSLNYLAGWLSDRGGKRKIFALGYFSLGFLLLKAHAIGFTASQIVLLYALFNATCVVAAPMAGKLGDAVGRSRVVLLGYALYGAINLALVFVSIQWEVIIVFAFYGFFYAIEESQSKALIADLEQDRRATAMGVYNFVTGLLYLPASLMAGALWTVAPEWAFGLAALLSLVAMGTITIMAPAGISPR